ncbi:MAG: hypothetical protein WAK48_24130 [Candidatus Acidiferrum sp.]|jgi:hypothetical protein
MSDGAETLTMRMGTRYRVMVAVAGMVFCCAAAGQDKTPAGANAALASYDLAREGTLVGTVEVFAASADAPPLGARVRVRTGNGIVDVHLGDARLLSANHFTLQSGDSVRIVGESVAYGNGTQFVARIVQKGTHVLAVRSVRGMPLSYMAPRQGEQAKSQGGAL